MWFIILPFILQAVAIFFDEVIFHRKRGLPRWERIGHPLDTLTVLSCIAFVLWVPFSKMALILYIILAIFSTLFVTKDEFVHNQHCSAAEQWLHAVLFILHPITLAALGLIWSKANSFYLFLYGQFGAMTLFFLYQIVFWNFIWKPHDQQ